MEDRKDEQDGRWVGVEYRQARTSQAGRKVIDLRDKGTGASRKHQSEPGLGRNLRMSLMQLVSDTEHLALRLDRVHAAGWISPPATAKGEDSARLPSASVFGVVRLGVTG